VTIKRESILAAITTALAGTTGVSTRIYRSRTEAFARNEAPALIVEPTDDLAKQEPVSICWIDWTLGVDIIVHTRGAIPDQLAGPIVESAHAKVMTDRTLGGLAMDIWPSRVQHGRDQADLTAGWTVLSYGVRYRTSITNLAT
jgi:hypothetical protein